MFYFKILILLFLINGTPPVLTFFFPEILKRPLDNNYNFWDGYPVLGKHKTIRGFFSAVIAGSLFGYFIGFSLFISILAGLFSMLGDCISSFIKRRLKLKEGTSIPGLDQIFEGGFPLLLFYWVYSLSWQITLGSLLIFIIIAFKVSKISKKLFSPKKTDSLRLVRSALSFREWRACHTALSPFARYLNFENIIYYHWLMGGIFKCLGIYNQGVKNALNVKIKSINLSFSDLPDAFNHYRILFISDLHIDGLDGLAERLIKLVSSLKVDVCLLGGDYRMEMYGQFFKAAVKLREIVKHTNTRDGVLGVLGNHDCLEITPELEDSGICMLINDSFLLERDGATLCIVGVDDPHYYKCSDIEKALREVPLNAFTILLSHSPEIIKDLDGKKIDLCLCGHTHGGQICLPVIGPVFTHIKLPRRFSAGLWQYNSTIGYTSNGAGCSGVPVRFNCPPEIVLLTLNKSNN